MAKEKVIKATISAVEVEGEYKRTLTAEIDGANEIIWLKRVDIEGDDDAVIREIPINFGDLRLLTNIVDKYL